jgi:hypothetical protein
VNGPTERTKALTGADRRISKVPALNRLSNVTFATPATIAANVALANDAFGEIT